MNKSDELAQRLRAASQSYYATGSSFMGDAEYDDGIRRLRAACPHDYTDLYDTSVGNHVDIDGDVVVHDVPMMSLAKAYTLDDVHRYVDKMTARGADGFKLQPKLDGMSLSVLYRHGRIATVSSRGNGTDGRNMSYLIGNRDVFIRNLPYGIPLASHDENVEVRGELLLTYADYEEASRLRKAATGEAFEAYRNANAGIANAARLGLGYHANLTFISYRLLVNDTPKDDDDIMASLNTMGFLTADVALEREWRGHPDLRVGIEHAFDDISHIIDGYSAIRDDINIPNDGIVIKPTNEDDMDAVMGSTAHHPSSQLAFKYVGERVTVDITDIEWSVGKQGHLTPTLVYAPTKLGTTTNDRATFHNASYVNEYNVARGSRVIIEWAGKVIPKFIDVISTPKDARRFTVPTLCPACHHPIAMHGRIAQCTNDQCPSRLEFILKSAISRGNLDIKTMGESILRACIDGHLVSDVPSLFALTQRRLETLREPSGNVVGAKTAATIMRHIDHARRLPFERIVSSLAINGLGLRKAGFLRRAGMATVYDLSMATQERLMSINGIGRENAHAITTWFHEHPDICRRLDDNGVTAAYHGENADAGPSLPEPEAAPEFNGHSFSISGGVPDGFANRNEFIEFIERHGGVFNPMPNAHTEYMIGDSESNSSKMRKARTLGCMILSTREFIRRFMA